MTVEIVCDELSNFGFAVDATSKTRESGTVLRVALTEAYETRGNEVIPVVIGELQREGVLPTEYDSEENAEVYDDAVEVKL